MTTAEYALWIMFVLTTLTIIFVNWRNDHHETPGY